MEEDPDECLKRDSIIDPVVSEESVPAPNVAEPSAAWFLLMLLMLLYRLLWMTILLHLRIVLP